MLTIILAVADEALAAALRASLHAAGHAVLRIERPLALLAHARRAAWDAVIVDVNLGPDVLAVLPGIAPSCRSIGAGFQDPRLHQSLSLPLDARAVAAVLATTPRGGDSTLVLRPERRVAEANGREVALTRTEYRLLEVLLAERPLPVPASKVVQAIWGHSAGAGTPAPLRGHVRNLRLKLSQIGLPQSVRSLRGKGYSLAL